MDLSDSDSDQSIVYTRKQRSCLLSRLTRRPIVPPEAVVPTGGFCLERTLFEAKFLQVLVDGNIRFAEFKG